MICVLAGAQRPHSVVYQSVNLSICKSFGLLRCRLQPQIVCCPKLQNIFNFLRAFLNSKWANFQLPQSAAPSTALAPLPPPLTLSSHGKWMANISSYFFGCMHFWPQASGLLQLSFFSASAAASVLLFFFPLLKQFFQLSLCNREGEGERERQTEKALDFHRGPKVADKVLEKVINLCTERRLRMKRGPAGEWRQEQSLVEARGQTRVAYKEGQNVRQVWVETIWKRSRKAMT